MVIEWLSFEVPQARRDAFIAHDAAIWTTALAACPGYLGKEVFCEHERPNASIL